LGVTRPSEAGEPYRVTNGLRTLVLAHLLALDGDDRYGRFGVSLSDAGISSYVGSIDFRRDIGLAVEGSDGNIIGFIHLACHGYSAELGASVSGVWRKQGIAHRLFKSALNQAPAAGIGEIHLAAAHPVARHIFTKLGYGCRLNPGYPRGLIKL